MLVMCAMPSKDFPSPTRSSNLESSSETSGDMRVVLSKSKINVKQSKEDAYMNMFSDKRLTPHPKTLAKVKGWMSDNELNQREGARILGISQTKLSHYLNGRKKIRGWFKLEDKIKEVIDNFDAQDAASESAESTSNDEDDYLDNSNEPQNSKEEEEQMNSDYSAHYEEVPDQWNKFTLNEIFNIKRPTTK